MSSTPTQRLYYTDAYLRQFQAQVTEVANAGRTVYLDRSAFYPTSGGQPHDLGFLDGVAVVEVVDEESRVAHHLASPLPTANTTVDGTVNCTVDWPRRYDLMQQHTGQHLLSSVLEEHFGLHTVSVALAGELCTVEVSGPTPSATTLRAVEEAANQVVQANHPVTVSFEDAESAQGLRKASARKGELRIVEINSVDRSACGGTHVARTGEIGLILLRKSEKIRDNTRIEFACGLRAIQLARQEYDTLQAAAKVFSASASQLPQLATGARDAALDGQKRLQKLQGELAAFQAKELYAQTTPGADGIRRLLRLGPIDDSARPLATQFCTQPKAVYVVANREPAAILVACSADSGLHAGNVLKEHLLTSGGRGGGGATLAQGTAPTFDALRATVEALGLSLA